MADFDDLIEDLDVRAQDLAPTATVDSLVHIAKMVEALQGPVTLKKVKEKGDTEVARVASAIGAYAPLSGAVFTGAVSAASLGVNGPLEIEEVKEKVNTYITTQGYANIYLKNGAVHYYTENQAQSRTINFMATSTEGLDDMMEVNQSMTVAVLMKKSGTEYINYYEIDGVPVTPKWNGGEAPTEGGESGIDIYSFTIIKTAANTFTVLGSLSTYA